MNTESWMLIPGFNGGYIINRSGIIKSFRNDKNGRVMSIADNGNGYKSSPLSLNGVCKRYYVHRLVAITFIPNQKPNQYKEVNHIDGVKSNNNADNLEWCNRSINNLHARRTGLNKGRDMSGSNNPRYDHGNRCRSGEVKNCKECENPFTAKYVSSAFCNKLCSGRYNVKIISSLKSERQFSGV